MIEVKVSEIIVENRVRATVGWLDSLERSIEQVGVLQPIGITPDKRLIFGERRLQACKNLGMETIPARIFDIDADDPVTALKMEREENEHRKDLTPSEKVEIGKRIEEALAGRQGNPTGANQYKSGNVQNFAHFQKNETDLNEIVNKPWDLTPGEKIDIARKIEAENTTLSPPQGKSRVIAAEAVGMNHETYRQAKKVVESGNREIIQAMDNGEISINAAYKSVRKTPRPRTFSITLYKNPKDDAEVLLMKGGHEYCTKLALALLEAAGHKIEDIKIKNTK